VYAKIIVDIKHEEVNQAYDYRIPDHLINDTKKGMRVIVPFGAQTRMGFIIDVFEKSDTATKDIIEVLDEIPTITDEMFLIIDHLQKQSLGLYSAVFATVIPSEITLTYEKDFMISLIKKVYGI